MDGTGATNARTVVAGPVGGESVSSAGTAAVWQHSAGRFTSSTNKQAFLNGGWNYRYDGSYTYRNQ